MADDSEFPDSLNQIPRSRDRPSRAVRVVSARALPPKPPRRPSSRALRGRQPPLEVTEQALRALAAVLAKQHGRATQVLGLVLDAEGNLGLVLDEPGEGDRIFVWNDAATLFVTQPVANRLAGHVLDHAGAPGNERFTLLPARTEQAPDQST
jgi:hypothetical protein